MVVLASWSNPALAEASGGLDIATGQTISEAYLDRLGSNVYYLGGADGDTKTGDYVVGGTLAVGAAQTTPGTTGITVQKALSAASGDVRGISVREAEEMRLTATGGNGNLMGVHSGTPVTINTGNVHARFSQFWAQAGAVTLTSGSLLHCNMLYLDQPSGATTNRVVDTVSGAFLSTAGVWTDAPSWAALKTAIEPVVRTEVAGLLDWLRDHYRPVRYRYAAPDGPRDQVAEYAHFGYLLDDLPPAVREIVCTDPGGGISGKDERGLLLSLCQELARRVHALEARP